MRIINRTGMFFLGLFFSHQLLANLIPIEKLFQAPEVALYTLSPDGQQVAYYQLMPQGHSELRLFEPSTDVTTKLLHVDSSFVLKSYDWIDNDTIYLTFREETAKRTGDLMKGFVSLPKQGNTADNNFKYIAASGLLLNSLPDQTDRFLFMRDEGAGDNIDLKIYTLTTDDLLNQRFAKNNRLKLHLDDALHYYFDRQTETWFAVTFSEKKGELLLHYLRKGTENWQKFYAWRDNDYRFEPVALIGQDKFLVLTNKETDLVAAYEFFPATQTLGKLLYEHEKYDLQAATVSPETGKLSSVSYFRNSRLHTEYFSEKNHKKSISIEHFDAEKQVYLVAANEETDRYIYLVTASNFPGVYYYVDGTTDTTLKLGSVLPDLEKYRLAPTETLHSTNDLGFEVEGLLTRPVNNSNQTLLVMPHGGPIGVRDYDHFDPQIQYLANRGFSILRVNFTGSSGFGKNFLGQGKGQFGRQIEKDIGLIVETARQKYSYQKACSIGSSYGGYSATMLAIKDPEFYQCIIAMYGIYDLPLLFNSSNYKVTESYRESITEIVGSDAALTQEDSPIYLVDKIKAPLLLIAGYADDISGIEQSNRLKYMLNLYDKNVDTMFYYGVGHGQRTFYGEQHQNVYISEFLHKHLNLSSEKANADVAIIANELAILGDVFTFDRVVKKDSVRGFNYYKKSSELGHPRANFNIGVYHEQGIHLEKDLAKAQEYYQIASENGYGKASFVLANRYKSSDSAESDLAAVANYMELAVEQGYDEAILHLAEAKCLGIGTTQNSQECLSLLEKDMDLTTRLPNQPINLSGTFRLKTTAKIIMENKFNGLAQQEITNFVTNRYGAIDPTFAIKVSNYGLYGKGGWSSRERYLEQTYQIPNKVGSQIRVSYGFESNLQTGPQQFWYYIIRWSYKGASEKDYNVLSYKIKSAQYHRIIRSTSIEITELKNEDTEYKVEFFQLDGTFLKALSFNVSDKHNP
ncbi:prolyl oligopeptidase family serine peptidase [Aliiglaciecola litoralis]|uniref:Peptidase S9 prolyl oligopeptidase catalytic domain-containing protein n=1 Tax=Aliiglaciecola litoralis TaxID=582857 RepID=A0ABN1LNZ1_9ALTE